MFQKKSPCSRALQQQHHNGLKFIKSNNKNTNSSEIIGTPAFIRKS